MSRHPFAISFFLFLAFAPAPPIAAQTKSARPPKALTEADLANAKPGRDPNQPIDEEYTREIKKHTTETFFLSPLVDYLPASKTVPTPKATLGVIAGAEGKLPYSKEVYDYMRLLAKSTPRVKVVNIGTSEEGREMIAVAVASEALMAKLDKNTADLARLADPRTIKMDDAVADEIAKRAAPIYYITGTIHSTEAGAPTALMELAYRLAVDDSPYIRNIREHVITLITPVVEPDGRDRVVDVYEWRKKHPKDTPMSPVYWGHYVAHDNNRDAMALTLKLSQNVLNTYLGWKAQVLHDLHESGSFLYDNTIGNGPYNAWLDPILTNEWHLVGWNNVNEMTRMGMPGVYAWGTFDTWSPGYLMFMAATHNGISRLYETFGNSGSADTEERTLTPNETSRTWFRQNPPISRVRWSLRNNNNYEQTGLLISLNQIASNRVYFLSNFYEKSKRSIMKAKVEGPAAYVFPATDPRPGAQAELLRVLQKQAVEMSRATAAFTVSLPARQPGPGRSGRGRRGGGRGGAATGDGTGDGTADANAEPGETPAPAPPPKPLPPTTREFPAGSYIVRMDQPYSRIADALLDYQYWAPNDPQTDIYDDTAWTMGELANVEVVRVTDAKVLQATMERVTADVRSPGGISNSGSVYIVNHNADNSLVTLRYRLRDVEMDAAEEPFEAAGRKFNRGSFIIRKGGDDLRRVANELGIQVSAVANAPTVKTHPVRAARIAMMHTWMSTQDEGWYRLGLDQLQVPFNYISTQDVSRDPNLKSKYDVILFAPVGRGSQAIINGMPMYGNPLPWKKTQLTPNLGGIDETDDMRPGLGWNGLQNLQKFVKDGGLFITVDDTSDFAVNYGFTAGVSVNRSQRLRAVGVILRTKMVDSASPLAYGFGDSLAMYCSNGPIYNINNGVGGRQRPQGRATGRGTPDDPDVPQGRPPAETPEPPPRVEPWEAPPVTDEQRRNAIGLIPPNQRPRVVMRYADSRDLFVSGLLDGGDEIAQRAAIIDVPSGNGHVLLFSTNPFWRGQTKGSYFLVFNAILNWDNLNAGRKLADK